MEDWTGAQWNQPHLIGYWLRAEPEEATLQFLSFVL